MNLLIYGRSGLAKEVYDLIMRSIPDRYENVYYIDDFADEGAFYNSESMHFSSIPKRFGKSLADFEGIVAVGEPKYREMLTLRFEDAGIALATIIDSTAIISPAATIEKGCIISEYSTIHSGAYIAKGVFIQPYCNIGHDIRIGEFSIMSTGCAPGGECVIGKRTYMGMNSSIKEKLSIGSDVVVAMGAVVFRDVEDMTTVIGNPARVTRGNDDHKVFK